jgi:hypothetical protein
LSTVTVLVATAVTPVAVAVAVFMVAPHPEAAMKVTVRITDWVGLSVPPRAAVFHVIELVGVPGTWDVGVIEALEKVRQVE